MPRKKGARDKNLRGDQYDLRPINWLDKKPVIFLLREGGSHDDLKGMAEYLESHKVKAVWYERSDNGEIALLATVRQRLLHLMYNETSYLKLSMVEWAPVKGAEGLRQSIPLRRFQDLIRNDNPCDLCRLYVVSEGDIIFYVGQAGNPVSRLCRRLDPYNRQKSKDTFGRFLRKYIDDALSSWRVQLLTLQDCESLVEKTLLLPDHKTETINTETIRSEFIEKYTTKTPRAVTQAEHCLIWLYEPCINTSHNPFRTPLPARYPFDLPDRRSSEYDPI